MTPDQQEFIRTLGILVAVVFAVGFVASVIAFFVNLNERQTHLVRICAGTAVASFLIMCGSLYLTYLSLG